MLHGYIVAIAFIVFATFKLKIHPFIVLLLVSYFVGFATAMAGLDIAKNISRRLGSDHVNLLLID
jgi:gluconate:H+ symporter, GntP family